MSPRVVHYSDLETAHDIPERAASVAACLCERDGPDTLVAGSGDNTGPGVLSLVTEGRGALPFFEAVDPDVGTVGNHDLDHGPDALLDLVGASPQRWVLANVERDGGILGGLDRWTTVAVDGTTVGVTGVLDPATSEMVPGLEGLAFLDPVAAVERAVEDLRAAGAETVVALAHTDTPTAEAIARTPGVDAVLAGHVHDPRLDRVEGTLLSRPGATGRWVFELDLTSGTATRHDPSDFPPQEGVRETLERRRRESDLEATVASIDGRLARDRSARTAGEWRLGNFVADAYHWATGADVGLQNTGGIRDGPPIGGEVTRADLIGLCPFEEPVTVVELTGEQLLAVVRECDGRRRSDVPDYWLGHVSGMAVSRAGDGYDVRVARVPVDPGESYTVATPRYVVVTDREFPTIDPGMTRRTGAPQYEVLVDYARVEGIDPAIEGRLPVADPTAAR